MPNRKPPLHDVILKPRRVGEAQDVYTEGIAHHPRPPMDGGVRVRTRPIDSEPQRRVHHERPQPEDVYDERGLEARRPAARAISDEFGDQSYNKRWLFIAIAIGAIVVLSSVALSLVFAGASVTVYPRQDTIVVDAEIPTVAEDVEAGLAFERLAVERTANKNVVALGEEQVEERARGTILIYNDFSEQPQRLIKNTRFEAPDGKIYRIRESVEVPGRSVSGDPGEVEVIVYAEEPGEDYNKAHPIDFSIPGFVGMPQEKLVYAKSVSDLTEGFTGVRRSISESDRMNAMRELEQQLRDELVAAAFGETERPQGYHLFKEGVFFEFNALPDQVEETDTVTVSLSGKLHGLLFEEDEFATRVAEATLGSYEGEEIYIENPDDLMVTLVPNVGEGDSSTPAWEASSYTVGVEGKARFVWEFDDERLARDLAGTEKSVLDMPYEGSLLQAYPGIDRMTASIRPFWKKAFPEEPDDIVIITELDA